MVFLIKTIDGRTWNCEANDINEAACKAVSEFGADKIVSILGADE